MKSNSIKTNQQTQGTENHNKLETVLTLDPDDTFLNTLLRPQTVKFILSIIQNIAFKTVAALLFLVSLVLRYKLYNTLFMELYRIIIHGVILIPFWSLYILNVNRNAFKRIISSFDFWVKLIYVIMTAITRCINKYYFDEFDAKYPILSGIALFLYWLDLIIMCAAVSLFDGYKINHKFKIIVPAMAGLYSLVYSLVMQFLSYSEGDKSIIHIYGPIAVSINSFYITATRNVAIFLLRQSVLSHWRANKAVTITVHPDVKWEHLQIITAVNEPQREASEDMKVVAMVPSQLQLEKVKSHTNEHDVSLSDSLSLK
eukprot:255559_1